MPYKNQSDEVKWRKENKAHIKRYMQDYYKKHPWFRAYRNIRSRCLTPEHHYFKKGIKICLQPKDLKFLWFRDKAYLMRFPSIDRIDNSKHYSLENCRYIELKENVRVKKSKSPST